MLTLMLILNPNKSFRQACETKMYSPALGCTDDVLFVTAGAGFRQTGDGGCMTKQHGPGTDLSREMKDGAEGNKELERER